MQNIKIQSCNTPHKRTFTSKYVYRPLRTTNEILMTKTERPITVALNKLGLKKILNWTNGLKISIRLTLKEFH